MRLTAFSNIEQIIFFGFWIIGQWRTTKEIGGSVLIYVLTLPFSKPRKDALRLVKMSPAGMEPAGAARHGRGPKGERMGNARVNRTKVRNNH